jgi:hypothetical protein
VEPIYLLFAFVSTSVIFFMLTWVVVSAWRICRPEESTPFVTTGERASRMSGVLLVGVREIAQTVPPVRRPATGAYAYSWGHSSGLPEIWIQDLVARRN